MFAICLTEEAEIDASAHAAVNNTEGHSSVEEPQLTLNDIAALTASHSGIAWRPYRCLFFCVNGLKSEAFYAFLDALATHKPPHSSLAPCITDPEIFACFALLLTNNMPRLHAVLSRLGPQALASLKTVLLERQLTELARVATSGWNIINETLSSLSPWGELQPHMLETISEVIFDPSIISSLVCWPSAEQSLIKSIFPVVSTIVEREQPRLIQQEQNKEILAQLSSALGQKLLGTTEYATEIHACIRSIETLLNSPTLQFYSERKLSVRNVLKGLAWILAAPFLLPIVLCALCAMDADGYEDHGEGCGDNTAISFAILLWLDLIAYAIYGLTRGSACLRGIAYTAMPSNFTYSTYMTIPKDCPGRSGYIHYNHGLNVTGDAANYKTGQSGNIMALLITGGIIAVINIVVLCSLFTVLVNYYRETVSDAQSALKQKMNEDSDFYISMQKIKLLLNALISVDPNSTPLSAADITKAKALSGHLNDRLLAYNTGEHKAYYSLIKLLPKLKDFLTGLLDSSISTSTEEPNAESEQDNAALIPGLAMALDSQLPGSYRILNAVIIKHICYKHLTMLGHGGTISEAQLGIASFMAGIIEDAIDEVSAANDAATSEASESYQGSSTSARDLLANSAVLSDTSVDSHSRSFSSDHHSDTSMNLA